MSLDIFLKVHHIVANVNDISDDEQIDPYLPTPAENTIRNADIGTGAPQPIIDDQESLTSERHVPDISSDTDLGKYLGLAETDDHIIDIKFNYGSDSDISSDTDLGTEERRGRGLSESEGCLGKTCVYVGGVSSKCRERDVRSFFFGWTHFH